MPSLPAAAPAPARAAPVSLRRPAPLPFSWRTLRPLHLALHLALAGLLTEALLDVGTVQAQTVQAYDIAPGPLTPALNQFAQAAGIYLTASGTLTEGRQSPGLRGRYGVADGLSALLAGTGLEAVRQDGNSYGLRPAPTRSGTGVTTLESVTVRGQAQSGVTDGTGAYTATGPSTTATGLALSLRETPQSITVVTRQKMDDFNLRTMKEVLDQTPGIAVTQTGDQIRLFARGAEITNFQADGQRVEASTPGIFSGNTLNALDDLADVDRVEVLKGSAGLLQGDGQPTATVNLVRKRPTDTFQARASAGVGSWQTYRAEADVSGPLNEAGTVRGRIVAAGKTAESFRDDVSNRHGLFYGTLDVDLSPTTLLNVGYVYKLHRNRGNAGWAATKAYDNDGTLDGTFYGWVPREWNPGAPWSGYEQTTHDAFASLEQRLGNDWRATLRASQQTVTIPDWWYGNINPPGTAPNVSRYQDLKTRTRNVSLDLTGPFTLLGQTHELLAGVNLSRTRYHMDASGRPASYLAALGADFPTLATYLSEGGGALPRPNDAAWQLTALHRSDTHRFGAYAATRLRLHERLTTLLGVRVSNYRYDYTTTTPSTGVIASSTNYDHSGVITPYAGLVFDISDTTSLYASYTSVFQPVQLRDEQGAVLNPREGITYETGAKAEFFDGQLNVSGAVFWKRWKNAYERTGNYVLDSNEWAYRNINGNLERGFEIEMSGQLAPGWQAQGSYVLNNNTLTGAGYGVSPKQQFKLSSTHTFASGSLSGLTVGGSARWQSSRGTGNTPQRLTQSPYWLVDAMARYRFNAHWSASVNVANVFDKHYFSDVIGYGIGDGEFYTWGAPRSVQLTMSYTY